MENKSIIEYATLEEIQKAHERIAKGEIHSTYINLKELLDEVKIRDEQRRKELQRNEVKQLCTKKKN